MMNNKLSAPLLVALLVLLTSAACTRKLALQSTTIADSPGFVQINESAEKPVYPNAAVIRNFYKAYGELTDAKWFKSATGFGVKFKYNGVKKTIYYTLHGLVDTEILYYSEDGLPPQIRHLVKSHFYDYAITYVTEVHKNDATAFYVIVEDASTIKTIKIVEDEWEVVKTMVKK
jgi:hypothetical protein